MAFEHLEEKEAVKIATLIEKNGYAFYMHLAASCNDKKVKRTLKRLASEEKRHKKVLEDNYYPKAGFGETITDEEIDIEDYVEKTTDPKVFTFYKDMEKLVKAINSTKKALLLAVQAEKYAADFFENMSRKASTEEGKRMYAELSAEEMDHIKIIENLLASL